MQFDHDDHMILLLGYKENFVSWLLSVIGGLVGGFLSLGRIFGNSRPYCQRCHVDSIAVSVFADIFIELTNTVSDNKIQITILIL